MAWRLPNRAWLIWGVLVTASFVVLEIIGVATKADGDTLSERIRERLGLEPRRPWRTVTVPLFTLLMVAFPVWFYFHIAYKWGWLP
jgi:hypothetical protein